ncbi:MAG: hypothetical protein ACC657_11220 [Thiohalomonadales bacterium]
MNDLSNPISPIATCKRVKIKLISIEYTSDHNLLKDNGDGEINDNNKRIKWDKKGKDIPKPQWTSKKSYPISHSMDEYVELTIKLNVSTPNGRTIIADLIGKSKARSGNGIFFKKNNYSFSPGTHIIKLKSNKKLERKVRIWEAFIEWNIIQSRTSIFSKYTVTTIYITLGKPVVGNQPEDGVTTVRLNKTINFFNNENRKISIETPTIILDQLFKIFETYTLGRLSVTNNEYRLISSTLEPAIQKKILSDKKLSRLLYENDYSAYQDNAWPLIEFKDYGAECQAIVRLIIGMLHQLGCPGTQELRFVSANARISNNQIPIKPNETIEIVKSYMSLPDTRSHISHPNRYTPKPYDLIIEKPPLQIGARGYKKGHSYGLVDREVMLRKYKGELIKSPNGETVAWNNYEAYLKFTIKSTGSWWNYLPIIEHANINIESWYGGGINVRVMQIHKYSLDKNTEYKKLITPFWGLVEFKKINTDKEVTNIWKFIN